MTTSTKNELTQSDWENDLKYQLRKEEISGETVDLGSILDTQGFSRQIKNIHFTKFNFYNFILTNLEFHDCNFSECDFRKSSLSYLQLFQCNCIKTKWLDSSLQDISFDACNLSHLELLYSEFQNVSIKNSMLSGSYWSNVQLSQLYIHNSVLNESVFYSTSIHKSSMSCNDLKDVFWIQNAGEFLQTKCTIISTNRPVVGMVWDCLQRGTFSPYIDDALRDNGAIVLKIEMQSRSIDVSKLTKEVMQSLNDHSNPDASTISGKLFCDISQKPEIGKIEVNATSLFEYCDAVVLPGGNDIEPEFYTDRRATTIQRDYRRSIVEFALLAHAHKRKLPIMGICRGLQIINVYFRGTLRQLPAIQMGWQHLSLSDSPKKAEIQQWISGTDLWAYSAHGQAADKIGINLEILMEHEGIPKILMSHDGQFIGIQFHPEAYLVKDFINGPPEAIHNKGIYQLFFSKILQRSTLKM